jgi:YgiT-type zinc finger domain-containing protein
MSKPTIPTFKSIEEEAAFWDVRDITDYLDEMKVISGDYQPAFSDKMRCVFCGGKIISENVTFVPDQGEQVLPLRNIPAEICVNCGEKTYFPETADKIINFASQQLRSS